LNADAV